MTLRVLLPGTNQIIHLEARILWTLHDNRAGAEFVRISTIDADILDGWLKSRHKRETSGDDRTSIVPSLKTERLGAL